MLVAILWEVYFCRPSLSPPHHSATLSRDKRATNKVILFFIAAAKATATTPIILKEMAAAAKVTATTPIIAVHPTNIPTPSSREQLLGNSPLTFPLTYTPLAAPPSWQIAAPEGMPFTPHQISTMTMTKADRIRIDIAMDSAS